MNDNERTAPESFLLLKFGGNVYTKDGKEGRFEFDDAGADAIISEFNYRDRDLVIDFEHSTLSGAEAPAAGWIDRLEKTAEGLCAHVKYWTDKARDYLIKGEYRYFSPTLLFGRGGKTPAALHSVALTNHPALHGVDALVANDTQLNPSDPLARRLVLRSLGKGGSLGGGGSDKSNAAYYGLLRPIRPIFFGSAISRRNGFEFYKKTDRMRIRSIRSEDWFGPLKSRIRNDPDPYGVCPSWD